MRPRTARALTARVSNDGSESHAWYCPFWKIGGGTCTDLEIENCYALLLVSSEFPFASRESTRVTVCGHTLQTGDAYSAMKRS
jgi:hypothetical protein